MSWWRSFQIIAIRSSVCFAILCVPPPSFLSYTAGHFSSTISLIRFLIHSLCTFKNSWDPYVSSLDGVLRLLNNVLSYSNFFIIFLLYWGAFKALFLSRIFFLLLSFPLYFLFSILNSLFLIFSFDFSSVF